MNETKHEIPQSEDLPILQEINSQHDNMRKAITKRYNAIKTLSKRWADSNIPSTIYELNMMKDSSITNDFFIYAIICVFIIAFNFFRQEIIHQFCDINIII